MFEPSLFTLYLKTFYLLFLYFLIGFSLNPKPIFRNFIGNLVFWQTIGIIFSFYLGFLFSKINLPIRSILYTGIGIIFLRAISFLYLEKKSNAKFFELKNELSSIWKKSNPFFYIIVTTLLVSIYFAPFIKLNTSGFYAYGGGDHTSYFGVSEFLIDHKMNELHTANDEEDAKFTRIPLQNYAVKSLVYHLARGNQWVYAPQILATAALAYSPSFPEETYTVFIGIILSILSWSVGFLALLIAKVRENTKLHSTLAVIGMVSSGGLSLALKHAIPSLFGWTICINLILIFLHANQNRKKRLEINPILLGLMVVSSVFLYFPSLLLNGLILFFLFILLAYSDARFWFKKIIFAFIAFLILGNIELERPFQLVFSNATDSRVLLDYGVRWKMVLYSTLGILDFESLLTSDVSAKNIFSIIIFSQCIGILLFIFASRVIKIATILLLLPAITAIYLYMHLNGHYHVIRISEFLGTVLPSFAFMGFYLLTRKSFLKKYKTAFIFPIFFCLIFIYTSHLNRIQILHKLFNTNDLSRAALKNADSLKFVNNIESYAQKLMGEADYPMGYWMHWGNVGSANNSIILRKIRYFESIEYDYQGSSIDILADKYIQNAFLIYPSNKINDILTLKDKYLINFEEIIDGHKIQSLKKGNGAALIGTGWFPPTWNPHSGKNRRILRSTHDAGLVIWSESEDYAKVSLRYGNNFPEQKGFLSIRYGDGVKKIFEEQTGIGENESSRYLVYLVNWIKLFNGNKIPSGTEPNLLLNFPEKFDFNEKFSEMKSIFSLYEFRIPIRSSGIKELEFVVKLRKGANVIRFLSLSQTGSIRHNFGGENTAL
jgi:hypothetical protein